MTPCLVVLQGGEIVKNRESKRMFERVAQLSETKHMLIIPWTSDSESKEMEYRKIFMIYFSECGFSSITFLEVEDTEEEISQKFSGADVLYLPGGDTEILWKGINSRKIGPRIRSFKGIVIGNSAGAIVLSKGTYKNGKFYEGLGTVDFCVSVHCALEEYRGTENRERPSICIPENMWIAVQPPG